MPLLTVIWGIICTLTSKVQNASGLLAIRFFLGVSEAGFLPAIIFWGAFPTALHSLFLRRLMWVHI